VDRFQFRALPAPIERLHGTWKYEFTIASHGVSLTDNLVLAVKAPDGKMLASLLGTL
jgi:hypothetical protein